MEAMTAKTGLSVLMLLFGWFQDGLVKLEQRDYPAAVAAFTKVAEHEQVAADLRERATYWRGVGYGRWGKMGEAKDDFVRVLGSARDPELRRDIGTAFRELGGDPGKLLPAETPQQAFESARKLALDGDVAGFRKRLGGRLASLLGMMAAVTEAEGSGGLAGVLVPLCKEIGYASSEVGTAEQFGTAKVVAMMGDLAFVFELVATGGEWRGVGLVEIRLPEAGKLDARQAVIRQSRNMQRIGRALVRFSRENNGKLPETLAELVPLLPNAETLEFVDAATGKCMALLYNRAVRKMALNRHMEGGDAYVVATPAAVQDSRFVVCADGRVLHAPARDFVKKAAEQGWVIRAEEPKQEPPKEVLGDVEALVKQLGAPGAVTRRTAYEKLKSMGEQAKPVLRKYRDHPDPEVRMVVRGLLE